jgi:L-malate glycosyltransferase
VSTTLLYIAPIGSPHTRKWVEHFAADDRYRVHVLDIAESAGTPPRGATCHLVKLPTRRYPMALDYFDRYRKVRREMAGLVREIRPDITHALWLGYAAYIGAGLHLHPFVATPWGSEILVHPKTARRYRVVPRRVLRHADVVTYGSAHMETALLDMGVDRARLRLVPYGIDVERFNPSRREEGFFARHGIGDGSPVIVSTRLFKPVYDLPTFLSSIPLVIAAHPRARFVLVGEGPERPRLESLVGELGMRPAVTFLGPQSDEDMVTLTASCDLRVSTSLSDGALASSTAESMACAVPVVVNDFTENRKVITDGVNGFLFPTSDHVKLAEKINACLADPALARRVGEEGRRSMTREQGLPFTLERLSGLYRELSGGR